MTEDNRLIVERRDKLQQIRENTIAFPNNYAVKNTASELNDLYSEKNREDLEKMEVIVSIAGRIMLDRKMFKVIQDHTGRIQIFADKNVQKDTKKLWDIGDIVWVQGVLCRSHKGDLYVKMDNYALLTKSLRPLPEKHSGLKDTETRYRQRYLDLIVNEDSRKTFMIRQKIVNSIRNYLVENDYFEAETPMLHPIPGGASAKPFITHHNSLDMDMYLRIAPELYLKRLIVGGFNRVFEINRNFRNEGVSTRHNPEFTMVEFYQSYANYETMIEHTENMIRNAALSALNTLEIKYQDKIYDLSLPFRKMTMIESICHFNDNISIEELNSIDSAKTIAESLKITIKENYGLGKIQTEIFEATVEHLLDEPTFITEYPAEVSPLARRKDSNPFVTERFEFFMGGREIANGFSELNDPEDQASRFAEQVKEKDAGDDEAMFYDEDYIIALEHGMPPTAGEGIGIDRLVMFLTNAASIRDVILFPHLKTK